jgi:hypothetical protein
LFLASSFPLIPNAFTKTGARSCAAQTLLILTLDSFLHSAVEFLVQCLADEVFKGVSGIGIHDGGFQNFGFWGLKVGETEVGVDYCFEAELGARAFFEVAEVEDEDVDAVPEVRDVLEVLGGVLGSHHLWWEEYDKGGERLR